jgi:manganese transport protein
LLVTGALAANFVREQVAGGIGPLSGFVLAFAVALGVAIVGLGGKYAVEEVG